MKRMRTIFLQQGEIIQIKKRANGLVRKQDDTLLLVGGVGDRITVVPESRYFSYSIEEDDVRELRRQAREIMYDMYDKYFQSDKS